jgi:RNA polymerase sigma-70 factor, ECF subfamily
LKAQIRFGLQDTVRAQGRCEGSSTLANIKTWEPQPNAAGSHAEFERLIERTQRQAYNIAYRMTGNRDDAEDLTQEAYLRAYRSFGTYNRQMPFESWFFRILSNLFIDLLRRRPKQKPLSLDQPMGDEESEENLLLQLPDENSNPERNLMEQVMDERLQSALSVLPEAFRVAVLLCDVEDKSYEEIAQIMGSSIGTVRSRIHRGRLMLRRVMDSQASPTKPEKRHRTPKIPAAFPALQTNPA